MLDASRKTVGRIFLLYNQMMNQENPGECMDMLIYFDGMYLYLFQLCV